jgi:hypothetical protein
MFYYSLCVCFVCDDALILLNYEAPCYTLGTIGKHLMSGCAQWSFCHFWTNKIKVIEFLIIFVIENKQKFIKMIFNTLTNQ